MDTSYLSLEGKIAMITGGSRGIGKAIALTFAGAGAEVVIASRKLPDLEKVAEEIKATGRKALCVPTHTKKLEDLENLVKTTMDEFGRIDVLVNNAATNPAMGPIVDTEESVYDHIIDTNLKGYFMMSKWVGKIMRDQKSGRRACGKPARATRNPATSSMSPPPAVSARPRDWALTASARRRSTC